MKQKKIKQKGSGIIPQAQVEARSGENNGVRAMKEMSSISKENFKIIKTFSGDYPEQSGGTKSKTNTKLKIKKVNRKSKKSKSK